MALPNFAPPLPSFSLIFPLILFLFLGFASSVSSQNATSPSPGNDPPSPGNDTLPSGGRDGPGGTTVAAPEVAQNLVDPSDSVNKSETNAPPANGTAPLGLAVAPEDGGEGDKVKKNDGEGTKDGSNSGTTGGTVVEQKDTVTTEAKGPSPTPAGTTPGQGDGGGVTPTPAAVGVPPPTPLSLQIVNGRGDEKDDEKIDRREDRVGSDRDRDMDDDRRAPSFFEPQACTSEDCNGRGTCLGTRAIPLCLCNAGSTGARCQDVNCDPNDNCHGRGWCIGTRRAATCFCNLGYSGTECQYQNGK